MADKITCILTSHEKRAFVHDSVRGVLKQTADDWQLLIMDSGKLYEAGEFDTYRGDPRVTLTRDLMPRHLRGRVCAQAWCVNECWRRGHVQGSLVCHLSDDDVYYPDLFATWYKAAADHPDWDAWYTPVDRYMVHKDGREVDHGPIDPGHETLGGCEQSPDCQLDGIQVCHRVSVRTDWFEDPDPRLTRHADGVWMHLLGLKVKIHRAEGRVGRRRHTPISIFSRSEG